jgi:hypothetical protein
VTDLPVTVEQWQAMPAPARKHAWRRWSAEQRERMYIELAASTPVFGIDYPTNYQDPADSPTALRVMALDVEAALGTRGPSLLPTGGVNRPEASALMTAGAWMPVLSAYPGTLRNGMGWWSTDAQFVPNKSGLHILNGRIQADTATAASEFSVGMTSAGPTDGGVILDRPVGANQSSIFNFTWVLNLAAGGRIGLRVMSTVQRRHSLVAWSLTYLGGF